MLRVFLYVCLFIFVFILSVAIGYMTYLQKSYSFDSSPTGVCVQPKHCGCCGNCSNTQDYDLYMKKNNTLTEDARACAFNNLFGDSQECLETIGLTSSCSYCWNENIKCTRSNCWFPCLIETILGISPNQDGKLSKCFACDEVNCLDGFIKCAGMSRRRAGIQTDIIRDISEVCNISSLNITENCSNL